MAGGGCLPPQESGLRSRAGDQAEGMPTPSPPAPAPWISGPGAQCQDKVGQDREKDMGQQLPPPKGSPTRPSSLLQCFSEELVGAMIVLKYR